VAFVSDRKIRSLNKKYLNHDYATDVLSFDLRSSFSVPFPRGRGRRFLIGEIVVSTDTAVKNAAIYGTSVKREIILYLIHGILHLLGYDDHTPQEIQTMRRKEAQLLAFLRM